MSKDDPSDAARINMTDDGDTVAKKIRRATSDSELLPEPSVVGSDGQFTAAFREARPAAANLLTIYAALTDRDLSAAVGAFAGKGFADFKQVLTDVAIAHLRPMGAQMQRMGTKPCYLHPVLRDGPPAAPGIPAPHPSQD